MTEHPEQQSFFPSDYSRLVDQHAELQSRFGKVWAENERRKLEAAELHAAILILLHRAGLPEVLLHQSERQRLAGWRLRREEGHHGAALFRACRPSEEGR